MREFPENFVVEKNKKLNAICPVCKKGNLIIRQNSENQKYFLGCTEYPDCKHAERFTIESKNQLKLFEEEK